MLTKIVHRTRDCVGIIAGAQHTDGPGGGGGGPDPCDPCGVDAYERIAATLCVSCVMSCIY